MRKIKFDDKEIDLLRTIYQSEIEGVEQYIKIIKGLLKKIVGKDLLVQPLPEIKSPKKRGRKPKVAKEKPVSVVPEKEGKKRAIMPKAAKQEKPSFEDISFPSPAKKEPKERIGKEKPTFHGNVKAKKQPLSITPIQEYPTPELTIDDKPQEPIKSNQPVTPPPQLVFSTSNGNNQIQKVESNMNLSTTPPPSIHKPILQSFTPANQSVKKKKFRPKRPRIVLQNLSKPITK